MTLALFREAPPRSMEMLFELQIQPLFKRAYLGKNLVIVFIPKIYMLYFSA